MGGDSDREGAGRTAASAGRKRLSVQPCGKDRNAMEDPVLAEAGLRRAGPCPEGSAAHPAASGGPDQQRRRAQVRRPHRARHAAWPARDQRAAPETKPLPLAGRRCLMAATGRPAGPCRRAGRDSARASRRRRACGAPCVRPRALRSASPVARDRARPQPRSIAPGRCGVSPLEGVAGDGIGSGAGEGLPRPARLVHRPRPGKTSHHQAETRSPTGPGPACRAARLSAVPIMRRHKASGSSR